MRFTLRGCSPAHGLQLVGHWGHRRRRLALRERRRAQQPDAQQVQACPPVQQAAATEMPQQANLSAIEQLQRRLDQQALEIQQLQTQLNSGTPATAAGFVASPAAAAPAPDGCPCQNPLGLPMCQPAPAAPPCCTDDRNDKCRCTPIGTTACGSPARTTISKSTSAAESSSTRSTLSTSNKSVEAGHGGSLRHRALSTNRKASAGTACAWKARSTTASISSGNTTSPRP